MPLTALAEHVVLRRLLGAMASLCLIVGLIAIPVVADGSDRIEAGADRGRADGRRVPADAGDVTPLGGGDGEAGEADAAAGAGADAPGVAGGGSSAGSLPVASGASTSTTAAVTTTLPPPPEGLGAPVDPGPPVAPRSGVYRYRTTGGPDGDGESTTRVEERARTGDEVRLSVTSAGGQLTTTSDVVWRPDGVRTLRSTLTFGDRSGECDWEPDVVDAVFPLQAGATWRTESSCAVTGFTPTPLTLQRTASAKVLELRRTSIGGQTVDVWAIEHVERLTGAGMSEEVTAVALFSPKHGVDVDLRGTRSGQEFRRELLSLEPAPA